MTENQNKDWRFEQVRVNQVVREIEKKLNNLSNNRGKITSDVVELRKTFWEDVTVNLDEPDDMIETAASIKQQAELLSERERTHKHVDKNLKTLERLKYSPYFGRIDFLEKGEKTVDKVYLGIASLTDETDENFLIYDWRAPISSLYYDYTPGPAQYETLDGSIVGEMELKRQFIIRSSEIKGMFDTGVTIGDEMLQEVLGNNANAQMKSIVATIQKEQNRIIRNEESKILIVKGVAGSGKTSAALQRVAYLLYRYRGTLKSENIMLFSPNPLFNSYVATVLPELGEENMQQATFMEYLNHRLGNKYKVEDPFSQMEYLLNNKEEKDYSLRIEGIRFKSSLLFKKIIDLYTTKLAKKGLVFKDLVFRGDVLISKGEIYHYFYKLEDHISIPNRIQLVKEWLTKGLKRAVKRERTKSWAEEEAQFLDKEDFMNAFRKLQEKNRFTENTFDDFEMEQRLLTDLVVKQRFKPLFVRVKNLKFIDMEEIYCRMLTEEYSVEEDMPNNWVGITEYTIDQLQNKVIPYEDATPFVYLQDLIEGRKSNTGVRHIFIDEAQDYSPFQFAFIQRLFPYSKMTLLGDFNQAIFSGPTGSKTVLTDLAIKGEEIETFELMKTYRSTKEIVEFTKGLIADGERIIPFNRSGKLPVIERVNSKSLMEEILNKVQKLKNEGHKTIAVIGRTAEESAEVFETLKDKIHSHLIEKGTISYEKGVLVIPSYLAKGIEFDAVILTDCSKYNSEGERKLLYTVCTRAMHELHIYTTGSVSPLFETVPKETYHIKG